MSSGTCTCAGSGKPAVARLDVIVNEDVEAFGLTILEPSMEGSFDEVRAAGGAADRDLPPASRRGACAGPAPGLRGRSAPCSLAGLMSHL